MTRKTEIELLLLLIRGYRRDNSTGDIIYEGVKLFNLNSFELACRAHRIARGQTSLFRELGCAIAIWAAQKPSLRFHPQAFNLFGDGIHFGGNRFTVTMKKDHFTSLMASGIVIPFYHDFDLTYQPSYEMWGFQNLGDTVHFYFRGRDGKD